MEGARLTEVTIPDSVTTIDSVDFLDSCIKTIHLGASATPWLIRSVWGVENYTVSEENETMCAVDGVIFSKDKTTILYYPSGREDETYTIPEGVTAIDSSAFGSCWNLTGLVLPASFGEITEKIYNYYLKTFTIPAEITYIAPKTIGYDWDGRKETDITIIGTSGSAAETYARSNGFTFRKLGTLGAETAGGSCGAGVTWSLQGTTLVISGTGAMADYQYYPYTGQTDVPWGSLSFDSVVVEPGITHIGNNAFCVMGWDNSTEFTVTLPEGW